MSTVTGQVVSAAYDQRVRVWGGPDLEWQFDLGGSPPWERSLTWSHDGARLLGGTFDGTLRVWEGKTGRFLYEIGGEGDEVGNACFNDLAVAGSGRAALVSDDGRVRTLRISRRSLSWEAAAAPSRGRVLMNAVAIDRRGRVVAGGAGATGSTLRSRTISRRARRSSSRSQRSPSAPKGLV